jgi:uncharacterized protein YigA (DUF484 family)
MSDDTTSLKARTSLKDVVASYLRKHPGFLQEFPDLLVSLRLSHETGAAVSLIERQVEQLRSGNEDLGRQLNRLVQVATENERLMARLHRLTLELMTTESQREFFSRLGDSLQNDFNADVVQICLFDCETNAEAGENVRRSPGTTRRWSPSVRSSKRTARCAAGSAKANWSSSSGARRAGCSPRPWSRSASKGRTA